MGSQTCPNEASGTNGKNFNSIIEIVCLDNGVKIPALQLNIGPIKTSQEAEGDSDQTLGGTLVSGQPDLETCKRLLRDFPTAYDNHKICSKVKEAGEFLDWLRANRNLCETSEDIYTAFTTNNCGSVWCQDAISVRSDWEAEYKSQCEVTEDNNRQDCKILENKLKAFMVLGCMIGDRQPIWSR